VRAKLFVVKEIDENQYGGLWEIITHYFNYDMWGGLKTTPFIPKK
jgi:hypothetical protein